MLATADFGHGATRWGALGQEAKGRAATPPLWLMLSDVDLLRNCQSVVDIENGGRLAPLIACLLGEPSRLVDGCREPLLSPTELMTLSVRYLEDVGISRRSTPDVRPSKPFRLP